MTDATKLELKTIQATDLRLRTREILEQVRWQGVTFAVTTFGHPVAVILSVEEYERLIATAAAPNGIPVALPEPSVAVGQ
jgi:prevent-host-death family protein